LQFASIISIIAFGCTIAEECATDSHLLAFWGSSVVREGGKPIAFAAMQSSLKSNVAGDKHF
jgi:hypothetical protein